jgi:hypothetical protein
VNIKNSLIVFLLLTGFLFAQQEDIVNSELKDSVYRYQGINPFLNINSGSFVLYLPYDFSVSNSNQLIDGDTATLWLRTELALSYFSNPASGSIKQETNLLLPLYNQYLENSKINPISYVLGVAQTAAVGYMAYRHIKKFGFFK